MAEVDDIVIIQGDTFRVTQVTEEGTVVLKPYFYEVGDIVTVTDAGRCYPAAEEILRSATNDVSVYVRFQYGRRCTIADEMKVLAVTKHPGDHSTVLLVEDITRKVYLINSDGVTPTRAVPFQ